jgi:hypothetical protein
VWDRLSTPPVSIVTANQRPERQVAEYAIRARYASEMIERQQRVLPGGVELPAFVSCAREGGVRRRAVFERVDLVRLPGRR